jgi:hypothetical protein
LDKEVRRSCLEKRPLPGPDRFWRRVWEEFANFVKSKIQIISPRIVLVICQLWRLAYHVGRALQAACSSQQKLRA